MNIFILSCPTAESNRFIKYILSESLVYSFKEKSKYLFMIRTVTVRRAKNCLLVILNCRIIYLPKKLESKFCFIVPNEYIKLFRKIFELNFGIYIE